MLADGTMYYRLFNLLTRLLRHVIESTKYVHLLQESLIKRDDDTRIHIQPFNDSCQLRREEFILYLFT